MKVLVVYIIIVLSIVKGNTQNPSWTYLEFEASSSTIAMEIDALGFLWLLSPLNLYKYDGYEIIAKETTTKEDPFLSLYQQGHFIHLGTKSGSIISYDTKRSSSTINPHNISNPISSMSWDAATNEGVVVSYGKGVQIKIGSIDTFMSTANGLISNEVYELIVDEKLLWLATDQGVQKIDLRSNKLTSTIISQAEGLSDIIITNLALDTEGRLWTANFDNAVDCIWPSGKVTTFPLPIKARINDLVARENAVYVLTDKGAYSLAQERWKKLYPNITVERVKAVAFDEEGDVWFCGPKNKLVKGSLLFQKFPYDLAEVQCLKTNEAITFVGKADGLFAIENGQSQKLLSRNITCLAEQEGLLWIGTYSDGVHLIDGEQNHLGSLNSWLGIDNQSVLSITAKADKVFVSSISGVIEIDYAIADGKLVINQLYSMNDKIGAGYIYQIVEKDQVLYFATDREGLKILRADTLVEIEKFSDGTKIGSVYSMSFDREDNLWFSSTKTGLGLLAKKQSAEAQNYLKSKEHYSSILTLSDGHLMMIRSNGVDVFNPSSNQLITYEDQFDESAVEPFFNTYDIQEDKVVFAQGNQIYQYNKPGSLKSYPNTVIDLIKVNLVPVANRHTFSQDENNIQFEYTASWLSNPEKLSYQYMLEGFDTEWRETNDRLVSYPRLNPGAYKFLVRASGNSFFDNAPAANFKFEIEKGLLNTSWFRGLILFGLASLIYLWRKEKIRQEEIARALAQSQIEAQLMNLQTQLNPHFLFNAFNILMGLIEIDPQKSIRFTEKLTDFYRSILTAGKNDLISLTRELEILESYIDILKERFQVDISISIQESESYLIPPLTLQLLVENAVKHNVASAKNPLKVSIIQKGGSLVVSNIMKPKLGVVKGTGTGLTNISKRCRLNGMPAAIIEKTDSDFKVTIKLKKVIL